MSDVANKVCTCPAWFQPVGRYTHHVECPFFVPFGDMVKPVRKMDK
jgi:hypothetical protein